MLSILRAFALDGLSTRVVRVEVDVRPGLPSFTIVGLPDALVREARERIRAACINGGFEFPLRRVVVTLAPTSMRKASPALDLPIAAALLAASGQLDLGRLEGAGFLGELALDGCLRSAPGVLPLAEEAKRLGVEAIVVPSANGAEAALAEGIGVVALDHISQLPALCSGELDPPPPKPMHLALDPPAGAPDLADLRGQPELRAALELAAAGGHSTLLLGPRASGKAMAAARLPSILPPLLPAEALEVARIHSAAGRLGGGGWSGGRPFRAPHHAISVAGLLGGGIPSRPGEATLAHRGVLYLDQAEDFRRDALEALGAPLATGQVSAARAGSRRAFPARFQLLAAADSCPCGRAGSGDCTCAPYEVERHRAKINLAIGRHVEISVAVRPPSIEEVAGPPGESSAVVADRVSRARELQERRFGPGRCNAQMTAKELGSCALHSDAVLLLAELTAGHRLSEGDRETALRVAQTIADLAESPLLCEHHLTRALRLLPSASTAIAP